MSRIHFVLSEGELALILNCIAFNVDALEEFIGDIEELEGDIDRDIARLEMLDGLLDQGEALGALFDRLKAFQDTQAAQGE